MTTKTKATIRRATAGAAAVLTVAMSGGVHTQAQGLCSTPLISGLMFPLGITQTEDDNLIVAESGQLGMLHAGRISIVGTDGFRRTLVDGLPSATNDAGTPSGPSGVVMRGRTLYVTIGLGDSILPVGTTPVRIGNPSPSSRLFSSVLAIHFGAHTERTTIGFSLTTADHDALADGQTVKLSNGRGDKIAIELVANFPDYVPNPLPTAASNVQGSNPYHLELIGDRLYVTDGGRNLVWKTDIHTGAFEPLATFAPVPNPTAVGGPMLEAVPTGIREFEGQLFVTLFRGFPFPPGSSAIEQVNPRTGVHAPLLTGLRAAIDVLFSDDDDREGRESDDAHGWSKKGDDSLKSLFVLQHGSGPLLPTFSGPGSLTRWDAAGTTVLADCLGRPTSMVRDERSGTIYVTELVNGRVVTVP